MVKSLIRLISNFTIRNVTHVHLMPLWYNSELNFDFRRTWKNRGYLFVGDLINENGELFSKQELKERNLRINFLDYFRVKQKLNSYIENIEKKTPLQGPQIPRLSFEIGMIQKGCGRVYNKLMNNNTVILIEVKNKWENALNEEVPYNTIEHAFKEISNKESGTYQKYFQFKLLHSRIITNEKLYNMNISSTKMCKTCPTEIGTLRHMFLECHTTTSLWKQVENWAKTVTSSSLKLTDFDKNFGHQQRDKTINKIILR